MDIKGFPKRLSIAMEEAGINARELALKAKISPSTLSHYKSGRSTNVTAEVAQKIADVLGVNVEWLVTGEGCGENRKVYYLENYDNCLYKLINQEEDEDLFMIPMYRLDFKLNMSLPNYEKTDDYSPSFFNSSFFNKLNINPLNCKKFKVADDSMFPLIKPEDSIIVDCSEKDHISNNQVYALVYDKELIVKRLIKTFRHLTIHSDNPKYPDEVFTLEEAKTIIHIVGKVILRSGVL